VLLHCTQSTNNCTTEQSVGLTTVTTHYIRDSMHTYRKLVSVVQQVICPFDSSCYLKAALMQRRHFWRMPVLLQTLSWVQVYQKLLAFAANSWVVTLMWSLMHCDVTSTMTTTTTVLRPSGFCPGLPGWASTSTVKPIWTVKGIGIIWAICKYAPRPRQITTPIPHLSVFYRLDVLPATQPTASKLLRKEAPVRE